MHACMQYTLLPQMTLHRSLHLMKKTVLLVASSFNILHCKNAQSKNCTSLLQ